MILTQSAAWTGWGCNPLLASARACENQVYLVSSTNEDVSRKWALTAVYNPEGKPIAHAETWGSVIVAGGKLTSVHGGSEPCRGNQEKPHHRGHARPSA